MNELTQQIAAIVADYQAQGAEQGIQVSVYHHGQQIVDFSGGTRNSAGDSLGADNLIYCWSMTKGLMALAMHIAAEKGKLDYDDLVCRYWPEFAQNGKKYISIRQFLAHTSGMADMPRVTTDEICDWDGMCARFAAMAPKTHPGESPAYHAISYGWLLGEVLRRADGRTVTQYIQDEICAPLGIRDLHIGLPTDRYGDTAELRYDGLPHPLNHDHCGTIDMVNNPAAFANLRSVQSACMPSINMMTSARALSRVYASLVGAGVDGVRLLPSRRVDMLRSVQRLAIDGTAGFRMALGLGYQLPDYQEDSSMSRRCGVFGHGGWGGSSAFADPDYDLAFALTKTNMYHDVAPVGISLVVGQAVRTHLGIPEA
jgi:CubicO group peptidase (beta-lactamase class C family)